MRILAISDHISQFYYDYYKPGMLDEFDLILSCGDLKREYLEFLVTLAHCPLLYVRGNHDDRLIKEPAEGCVCIEDQIYVHQGVRILGLGGSYRYRDGENMYTEQQMERRIKKLKSKLKKFDGFDILLTHAPARHINDFDTLPHRGFECFVGLLEQYRPKYFIHGHIHQNYGVNIPQKTVKDEIVIINACEYCRFDYENNF